MKFAWQALLRHVSYQVGSRLKTPEFSSDFCRSERRDASAVTRTGTMIRWAASRRSIVLTCGRVKRRLNVIHSNFQRRQSMINEIFALSPEVRYVATYLNGELEMRSRNDLQNSSEGETDTYEELLVNPTLLKLATQRGNIDCGGLNYLLIRYGNFFQFVRSVPAGHVSICIEPDSEIDSICKQICAHLDEVV